jgi:mannose/fructose/sorbose-specific phosphotransferase system IIA component
MKERDLLTGILIVTHGNLSESLLESASMFVSNTKNVHAISFYPGQGVEDLIVLVRGAMEQLASSDGILALVDLPGGSPARAVGTIFSESGRLEIVSGVNLPMLVEVLMMRDSMLFSELTDYAVLSGNEGIVDIGHLLRGGDS